MAKFKIKPNILLRQTDLEFEPQEPREFTVTDELLHCLSWLTGCTRHDRKLLRCNEDGALLVDNPWALYNSVETDELYPDDGSPDTYTATVANKGVLVATSTEIVKITFTRVSGGATEDVYVSPDTLYWFGHSVYSVIATVVPASGGTASYVGITAFN